MAYQVAELDCQSPSVHGRKWNELLHFVAEECRKKYAKDSKQKAFSKDLYTEIDAADLFSKAISASAKIAPGGTILLMFDEIERISFGTGDSDHWKNGDDFVLFWQSVRSAYQEISSGFTYLVAGTNPESLERFEGFASEIYVCPGGWPTIGYGHVVRDDERERFASGVDEATAEGLLRRDVETAERAVLRFIRVPLADGRFDALGSFAFNLGAGALQRSTLRRKVNREEHGAVPEEFRRWVFAGGRKLKGLIRRREAEAAFYAAGWNRTVPING